MPPGDCRRRTGLLPPWKAMGSGGMRERVEMLGGTLDRRNKSGTTLTITLPLKEVAIKDVAEKEAIAYPEKAHEFESSRCSGERSRKTIRVVLAEDQGMVLGALAALLEIEGDISVVAQARNGKEALEAVLAHRPDVFITDIEMPHMSGLAVAAELRRQRDGNARGNRNHIRAHGIFAPSARVRCVRISAQRHARRRVGRCRAPRASGSPGAISSRNSATRSLGRNGSADRPRAPGPAPGRRSRMASCDIAMNWDCPDGHRTELSFRSHCCELGRKQTEWKPQESREPKLGWL